MAADIISATRDALIEYGIDVPSTDDLVEEFKSTANRLVDNYAVDSKWNGLTYDHRSESDAIDVFANRIADTWRQTINETSESTTVLPPWGQLISQDADVLSRFRDLIQNEVG